LNFGPRVLASSKGRDDDPRDIFFFHNTRTDGPMRTDGLFIDCLRKSPERDMDAKKTRRGRVHIFFIQYNLDANNIRTLTL
jgi:hypothetical protein